MKPAAEIVKRVRGMAYNHDPRTIFADFCEMYALAISQPFNQLNKPLWERREEQYLRTVRRYSKSEVRGFLGIRDAVVEALEMSGVDVLGSAYEELEVANKDAGQFFTPYHLCELIAELTVDEAMVEKARDEGFITIAEPACGAGAMIIAVANIMRAKGLNPQRQLHITAIDKSATAAYMCYIQLSLLGIPASVWIGNTLSMEMQERFLTPMHMMGGWAPSRGDVLAVRQVAQAAEGRQSDRPAATHAGTPSVDVVLPDREQLELFDVEGAA